MFHEYLCDKCGKPAKYNLQGGGYALWEISSKGKFEIIEEWGLGEEGENTFLCEECAEKEEII